MEKPHTNNPNLYLEPSPVRADGGAEVGKRPPFIELQNDYGGDHLSPAGMPLAAPNSALSGGFFETK
jgi:hypothetical protein